METPFSVVVEIARILEAQGIAYVVVGSFASSMRGLYRSTADLDILADIKPDQVKPLVAALQETFYVDEQAAHQAVSRCRSFNAIQFDSVFKVDIFIPPADDFSQQQLARRQMNFSRSKLRHIKSKISDVFAASCGELTP